MWYGAVVMMTHYDKRCEIDCIRNMYNMGVVGIILCSVNGGEEFDNYLKLLNILIVAVGNDIGGIPYVGIDDFAAMRDMTKKQLSDGYKNLIYYSPALNYSNAHAQRARYEGFLSAASESQYTVITDIQMIKESYPDGTCIICSTDYYAMSVYFRTKNAKVVGFDDLDAIEKYRFSIDSVGYSIPEIARFAVDTVLMKKRENVIVEHKLVSHPS